MGNVRTKQKCPECGAAFAYLTKNGLAKNNVFGLVRPVHTAVRPTKYYVEMGKKWDKVYVDKHGRPLTSFPQALETQKEIDALIAAEKYRADRYKRRGAVTRTISGLTEDFFDDRNIAPSFERDFRRHVKAAADFFPSDDVHT